MTRLSICIVSLHSRKAKLDELLACLADQQPYLMDTELLIAVDDGQDTVGSKRNRLVGHAIGQYICHIDDDDLVHHRYIKNILMTIDPLNFTNLTSLDAVAIRGQRIENDDPQSAVEFDYRVGGVEGEWIDSVLWRSPGHLCPIRADLAKSIPFEDRTGGEDLIWSAALAPSIKTCRSASSEVLYYYRWDSRK